MRARQQKTLGTAEQRIVKASSNRHRGTFAPQPWQSLRSQGDFTAEAIDKAHDEVFDAARFRSRSNLFNYTGRHTEPPVMFHATKKTNTALEQATLPWTSRARG